MAEVTYYRCGWCRHIVGEPLVIVSYIDGDAVYSNSLPSQYTKGVCVDCYEDEFGGSYEPITEPALPVSA